MLKTFIENIDTQIFMNFCKLCLLNKICKKLRPELEITARAGKYLGASTLEPLQVHESVCERESACKYVRARVYRPESLADTVCV